jgi:FtsP/CotA-like multicopper oxidase with cupredoxin domain
LPGGNSKVMSNVTRRSLLGGASLGLALSASGVVKLAHAQGGAAPATGMVDINSPSGGGRGAPRVPFATGAALIEPEVRRSAKGELRTNLRVRYAYKDIGGYRLSLRTYDDTIPGPTLRVRTGDVLRIRLSNELPPNPDPVPLDMALPHHFNTTNFHAHGLHVDPGALADNIFRSMEPGQAYDIEIAIPANHPSGTFWYHPHHHGSADVQMVSGMAGALIVEGDFADMPEIAGARERVLILNEVVFDYRGSIENYDTVWPEAVPRFLSVNGQREPAIGRARFSAGASSIPATRTIFASRWPGTCSMSSRMTGLRWPGCSAWKTW